MAAQGDGKGAADTPDLRLSIDGFDLYSASFCLIKRNLRSNNEDHLMKNQNKGPMVVLEGGKGGFEVGLWQCAFLICCVC